MRKTRKQKAKKAKKKEKFDREHEPREGKQHAQEGKATESVKQSECVRKFAVKSRSESRQNVHRSN